MKQTMFLSEHIVVHLFCMNKFVSVVLFQPSASFCPKIKSQNIRSGSIRLNKFSAYESLRSRNNLVSDDFGVHHDGIIEVDSRNG